MARILVIDDDPEIRDSVEETLVAAAHEVLTASNGKDGIQLCRAHPPDLVITDLLMPEKDGLEIIQELRSRSPRLKIIAMSGAPSDWKVLEMAKKLGAQETLTKPFLAQEMVDAVARVSQGA